MSEPDLTDEQINAVYQATFNAQSDRARAAPPAGRLVFEFARAIAALSRTADRPEPRPVAPSSSAIAMFAESAPAIRTVGVLLQLHLPPGFEWSLEERCERIAEAVMRLYFEGEEGGTADRRPAPGEPCTFKRSVDGIDCELCGKLWSHPSHADAARKAAALSRTEQPVLPSSSVIGRARHR